MTANYKLDWFGTVRGRVGFVPTERVLLYATGGLAYGHLLASAPLIPLSWGSTRAGWTVGAGAEAAIDRNWSVKLEYLYMDLGDIGSGSASPTNVVNQLNTPLIGQNTVTTTTLTTSFRNQVHRQYRARRLELSVRWPRRRQVLSGSGYAIQKAPVFRGFFLRRGPGVQALVRPPCVA
ncbi:outer membrane protein [Bradyrhizobium sp. AUGA SZCCT0240]|uniref:outer membrane protein n=1 Tax=Bradyrhizobium sp. AUGA SZCCT0240 TaxID=2807669 RepID=UPI002011EB03|nr:outer membrane beta-barrel protein [Bradyrhizobium sp. AUGA SZCCT0240]